MCPKHPTYRIVFKPTAQCLKCHQLWLMKQYLQEQ